MPCYPLSFMFIILYLFLEELIVVFLMIEIRGISLNKIVSNIFILHQKNVFQKRI